MQSQQPPSTEPMKLVGTRHKARRSWPTALALLVCLSCGASGEQVQFGFTRFVSKAGGYVAYYPSNWHVFSKNLPTLNIDNFPFSRAGGGVLPDGGAQIAVVPAPLRIATLEEWITADSLLSRQVSRWSMDLPRPNSAEPLSVTEVESRISEGMAEIDCYFSISGRLLVARLSFWPSDPRAGEYRELLHKIVKSVRPLTR